MKKNLLYVLSLFSGILFGQFNGIYDTDLDGQIYFKKNLIDQQGNSNENQLGPNELMLDWSGPDFNLSENPTIDSWDVRLTAGSDNVPYVVYNDNHPNGLQKIMFRKKLSEGEWSEAIFVDAGGEIGDRNNHFPAIGTSPNGDLHVVYNVWAYENVRNYIGYSHYDAAAGEWSEAVKISDLNGTVSHFNAHHDIYSTSDNFPVVVWGYDYRENLTNEEIYMTYFDGENWSADVAVSDVSDGLDAGYPFIKGMGNNRAMIVYSENTSGGTIELKYRIYDEATHTLSEPELISNENIGYNNYVLASSGEGNLIVATLHKASGPDRDIFRIFSYDETADEFTLTDHLLEIPANAGGLLKRFDMDCNSNGDCAIIYTDFLAETNSYLEYYPETGFGETLVINEEDPGFEAPSARFSPDGNLHVAWSDYRFDDGEGWDEREVMYEMGRNELMGTGETFSSEISVYPNPTNGSFTVRTDGNFQMEIFSMSGKSVHKQNISGSTQLNLSLSSGVYLIRLSNENGNFVKKLLVR